MGEMYKIMCLGQVHGRCEEGTFPELEKLLSDGWIVKDMQAASSDEGCCCYVWIKKDDK